MVRSTLACSLWIFIRTAPTTNRLTATMNLRDQLKEILPEILPPNPAEPIKGTELIRLVKFSLKQEYSDATLRYHFSIMCCDPASPIAKVEQGQGYYLRRTGAGLSGSPPISRRPSWACSSNPHRNKWTGPSPAP